MDWLLASSVTRLTECSLFYPFFTFANFLTKSLSGPKIWGTSFPEKKFGIHIFFKIWVGQHFWAIFSQPNLVTLLASLTSNMRRCIKQLRQR
jgi:hypothetical protein